MAHTFSWMSVSTAKSSSLDMCAPLVREMHGVGRVEVS
jgi:hypothetical protein